MPSLCIISSNLILLPLCKKKKKKLNPTSTTCKLQDSHLFPIAMTKESILRLPESILRVPGPASHHKVSNWPHVRPV